MFTNERIPASGRRDDRPGLAACLKALREGDTLLVWKLDRLGRDLRHLINTVHDLTARSVGLKVLTGHGAVRLRERRDAPALDCKGSKCPVPARKHPPDEVAPTATTAPAPSAAASASLQRRTVAKRARLALNLLNVVLPVLAAWSRSSKRLWLAIRTSSTITSTSVG